MKRKQIPGNMDSSPQKMSRRKALATMAGAVGLAALPGVGHALNPIKNGETFKPLLLHLSILCVTLYLVSLRLLT